MIGIEYETIGIFYTGGVVRDADGQIITIDTLKEVTVPLTTATYTSPNKLKRQLNRKLKCLESKISLIKACIRKLDPTSSITNQIIKDLLKTIIMYHTILYRVKNESLTTMITMRTTYENALNALLTQFNGETNARINKVTVNILLPDVLPSIGASLTVPPSIATGQYKVTSVSVSGVTATIVGEYNA
jgi:hypothetical protein